MFETLGEKAEEKAMVQFLERFTDYPFLVRFKNSESGTILLWKRSLGAGNYRNFVWREYSVGRSESNGNESVC